MTCHPFVVQLHSAFQTRQHLYLVMDYCAGGDLGLHIRSGPYGRLPEPAACFVCAELLLAIEALHDAGVIHRDIKAENVLIDALGHVKIADLNAAKRDERLTSGGRTYTVVGTPFAAAPEVLRGKGYTVAADWWSYGVLMFECLVGRPPYPADQKHMHAHARLIDEILHGERAPWRAPWPAGALELGAVLGGGTDAVPGATPPDHGGEGQIPEPDESAQDGAPPSPSAGARELVDRLLVRDEHSRLADPAAMRAHAWFEHIRWSALLAKQVPSPLRPRAHRRRVEPEVASSGGAAAESSGAFTGGGGGDGGGGGGGGSGGGGGANGGGGVADLNSGDLPFLDVFAYPSHLHLEPLDGGEGSIGLRASDSQGGEVSGWDYVARAPALWSRARRKVDQLARLQGLSRTEFLVWLLLTLAADRAAADDGEERVPGSVLRFAPTDSRRMLQS